MLLPVRLIAMCAVASQTSEQSRHMRMHCRQSMGSAEHASAHDVQNSEHNMAWRAAVTSGSLKSLPTWGCSLIIFSIDIVGLGLISVIISANRAWAARAFGLIRAPRRRDQLSEFLAFELHAYLLRQEVRFIEADANKS
ncbi:MAG: hypothetical protein ABW154_14370 [Dyella sp.]